MNSEYKSKKYIFVIILFINISFIKYSFSEEKVLPQVKVQKAEKIMFNEELKIVGSINANESVEITSVVSEKIKSIKFIEGSFVKKNDILIELENNEEKAILKQVDAELEESRINYERAKKLLNEGNASQSMIDKKYMEKKKLEGKFQEIEAKLNDLIIKAPFDGMIGTKNYSNGSFINPGDVITSLYDISKIKVEMYIPEIYVNDIYRKQEFSASLPSINNTKFKGKLFAINPSINTETRTFKVIGIIKNNSNFSLKPGMMSNIKLKLKSREIFVVPEGAIIPEDEKSFLYVFKDKKALKMQVKTGKRKNGSIEIISGINQDNLIVYEGTNKIRNGSEVSIIK